MTADLWTEPNPMTTEADWEFSEREDARWRQEARARGWRARDRRWRGVVPPYCPAPALGRRCHLFRPGRFGEDCICHQLWATFGFSVVDHYRVWTDVRTGQKVQTLEPYWDYLTPEQAEQLLAELREWCAEFGLTAERGERSPYYPGRTTLLIVRKAAPSRRPSRSAA
jgi:hypothetical protein